MNNSPLSPLSPASLSTSFPKSLRTPATENPWTSGWQVWSLPHAYTNERQAHCFLSLHSHYHVRSPLWLLPFLCRQHQDPWHTTNTDTNTTDTPSAIPHWSIPHIETKIGVPEQTGTAPLTGLKQVYDAINDLWTLCIVSHTPWSLWSSSHG